MKKGDKVVCLDASNGKAENRPSLLVEGKIYTVLSVDDKGFIEVYNIPHCIGIFNPKRFRKIEPTTNKLSKELAKQGLERIDKDSKPEVERVFSLTTKF